MKSCKSKRVNSFLLAGLLYFISPASILAAEKGLLPAKQQSVLVNKKAVIKAPVSIKGPLVSPGAVVIPPAKSQLRVKPPQALTRKIILPVKPPVKSKKPGVIPGLSSPSVKASAMKPLVPGSVVKPGQTSPKRAYVPAKRDGSVFGSRNSLPGVKMKQFAPLRLAPALSGLPKRSFGRQLPVAPQAASAFTPNGASKQAPVSPTNRLHGIMGTMGTGRSTLQPRGIGASSRGDATSSAPPAGVSFGPGGRTYIDYGNGSGQVITPDGRARGVISDVDPSSGVRTDFGDDGSVTTTLPGGGSSRRVEADGTVTDSVIGASITHHPDGSVTRSSPGVSTTFSPDGSVTETNGITTRTESPDGTVTESSPGYSRTERPDGTVTETVGDTTQHFDGSTTTNSGDSSVTEFNDGTVIVDRPGYSRAESPDGTVTEKFNDGSRTQTGDGTVTEVFGDGSSRTESLDGTVTDVYDDGSSITRHPDGTVIQTIVPTGGGTRTEFLDGTVIEDEPGYSRAVSPDGTVTEKFNTGSRTVRPDGTIIETDSSGTVKTIAPDGSVSISGPGGSTATDDKADSTTSDTGSKDKAGTTYDRDTDTTGSTTKKDKDSSSETADNGDDEDTDKSSGTSDSGDTDDSDDADDADGGKDAGSGKDSGSSFATGGSDGLDTGSSGKDVYDKLHKPGNDEVPDNGGRVRGDVSRPGPEGGSAGAGGVVRGYIGVKDGQTVNVTPVDASGNRKPVQGVDPDRFGDAVVGPANGAADQLRQSGDAVNPGGD